MLPIAATPALSWGAGVEDRAPRRRIAATTSALEDAESARATTSPVAPHRAAMVRVSATSRAAPRVELVGPLRRRVAAMTGAEIGVDTIPTSAFNPFPFV